MSAKEGQPWWSAVVVAAGRGERFGGSNKLLEMIDGIPVIGWTVRSLAVDARFKQFVVVTSPAFATAIKEAVGDALEGRPVTFCPGGATRGGSVKSGLQALADETTHVAVHDGARPLPPPQMIREILDAAEQFGAAVPALPPSNTIALRGKTGDRMTGILDRTTLCEIQTPQAALRWALVEALNHFPDETDESSALFRSGHEVVLVPGSRSNLKITGPEDLVIANAFATFVAGKT